MSNAALATIGKEPSYIAEYDAIVEVMNRYCDGVRAGDSSRMKVSFHENCTFFGHYSDQLLAGPIQLLFDWVDANGPAPELQARFGKIEILGTIASVRIELETLKGKLAGQTGATLSDLFQLVRVDGQWLISQKSFHWHAE